MPAIPLPDPPLDDGVVALRPPAPPDAAALLALWRDADVRRWTAVPPDPTPALAGAWIASRERRRLAGRGLDLVVVEAGAGAPGTPVGTVSLDDVDLRRRTAEVGYVVAPASRRRGVARRAVALLAGWALSPAPAAGPALGRLALRIHAGNAASTRVAEATGFTPVGAAADPDDGRPVVTWWRWASASVHGPGPSSRTAARATPAANLRT